MKNAEKAVEAADTVSSILNCIYVIAYFALLGSGKLFYNLFTFLVLTIVMVYSCYVEIKKIVKVYKSLQYETLIGAAKNYNADYFKGE